MFRFLIIGLFFFQNNSRCIAQENCLYKNPEFFSNTDILAYLQVLDKNKQYQKMEPFFTDHFQINIGFESELSDIDFGYSLKRVGVK
jgi:hypothetical protein